MLSFSDACYSAGLWQNLCFGLRSPQSSSCPLMTVQQTITPVQRHSRKRLTTTSKQVFGSAELRLWGAVVSRSDWLSEFDVVQALCAVLEYELSPSGEQKLDLMTTLRLTDVGKQRQAELAARLRTLKQMVQMVFSLNHSCHLNHIYCIQQHTLL